LFTEEAILFNPGLLLVMGSHSSEEAAVRDAPSVKDITSAVDHDVHVTNIQPAALEGTVDRVGDEIDMLMRLP
jgi:hypothetical protein